MNLGKTIRLNRLFAHPSGRFCSIAVDHLLGYGQDMPPGLLHIRPTLAAIMAAKPDAVTMHKGIAASLWAPYAGQMPLIIQGSGIKSDDTAREIFATPEDAVRLGADAYAVAAFIRGRDGGRGAALPSQTPSVTRPGSSCPSSATSTPVSGMPRAT